MRDAINSGFPICVSAGTYSDEFLRAKFPEIIPLLRSIPPKGFMPMLESGECEVAVTYKQYFDAMAVKKDVNPTCSLEWQGRPIKTLVDGFATKLDSGIKCTDLVNSVLSYYIQEMHEEGWFEEKWEDHNLYYGTKGHCQEDSSVRRNLQILKRRSGATHRRLKPNTKPNSAAAAGGGAASTAGGGEDTATPLTASQMAGAMTLQVVGCLIGVLVAYLGKCEGAVCGRAERKRLRQMGKSVVVTDRQLQMQCRALTERMSMMQDMLGTMHKDLNLREESFKQSRPSIRNRKKSRKSSIRNRLSWFRSPNGRFESIGKKEPSTTIVFESDDSFGIEDLNGQNSSATIDFGGSAFGGSNLECIVEEEEKESKVAFEL